MKVDACAVRCCNEGIEFKKRQLFRYEDFFRFIIFNLVLR